MCCFDVVGPVNKGMWRHCVICFIYQSYKALNQISSPAHLWFSPVSEPFFNKWWRDCFGTLLPAHTRLLCCTINRQETFRVERLPPWLEVSFNMGEMSSSSRYQLLLENCPPVAGISCEVWVDDLVDLIMRHLLIWWWSFIAHWVPPTLFGLLRANFQVAQALSFLTLLLTDGDQLSGHAVSRNTAAQSAPLCHTIQ